MGKRLLRLCALFILFIPIVVFAEGDIYVKDNGSEGVVDHSLFTVNNVVNSKETVNGLNFVAGNNVTVTGENEYGFYAANDITITNKIVKDLFVAGNNIVISSEANIGRDLYAAGSNLTINGNISNNAFVAGSIITLKDVTINGDLRLACDKLNIEGVVTINGTLYVDDAAVISNENNLMANAIEKYSAGEIEDDESFSSVITVLLTSMASIMLVGFIINAMCPKVYEKLVKEIEFKNLLKNIGIGLLALIVIPIVSLILLCTIVGVRLGFLILLLYVIMLMLAILYVSMLLGNVILTKLFKTNDNPYLAIAIGVVVIKLVGMIPGIGGLVYFLAILCGLGKILEICKKKETK